MCARLVIDTPIADRVEHSIRRHRLAKQATQLSVEALALNRAQQRAIGMSNRIESAKPDDPLSEEQLIAESPGEALKLGERVCSLSQIGDEIL